LAAVEELEFGVAGDVPYDGDGVIGHGLSLALGLNLGLGRDTAGARTNVAAEDLKAQDLIGERQNAIEFVDGD
jgi:hypothetical protein